jgi:hypothetical protein
MSKQTFFDPRGRGIIIEVSNEFILFFFAEQVKNQQEWISEQEELGNDISEEDKKINEFYWIETPQWVRDKTNHVERGDNFHHHMKEKNWFTEEMYDFINKNTPDVCSN